MTAKLRITPKLLIQAILPEVDAHIVGAQFEHTPLGPSLVLFLDGPAVPNDTAEVIALYTKTADGLHANIEPL
jgi:hypothetical protein